ncbi:hypothetical protein A5906_00570 [Bradyrhizobium sacchari]|uniref:Uncharacterized protein n=2 Tax=Bradyrhizobium sacchari TaxID=1399419 RepID=A0A560K725_9BRAD|nr:hypothetical protein [Bradyrhizobium sacchari]OPY96924.1 hypothetical protein A5906_00570 [Bradyrhizobium sacchari]TWB55546.1 hypothetical protein FBZ94_10762 [Bradyrhizobium sacchari]TWB79145.1 hypothetical protein FBZ95_103997 [Bradyrhizobium sacchari]
MPAEMLSPDIDRFRLHPVAPRLAPMFCLALLTASCALASFALACATPFAAFAVVAAAMLPPRPALLVVAGAWLVNQSIGFGVLHYPVNGSTLAWGFIIGAAALVATAVSSVVFRALPQARAPLMLAITLVVAYAAYELVLLAATPFLGGEGAFTAAIMTRLGLLSAVWLAGLVAACEIVRLLDPFGRKGAMSA